MPRPRRTSKINIFYSPKRKIVRPRRVILAPKVVPKPESAYARKHSRSQSRLPETRKVSPWTYRKQVNSGFSTNPNQTPRSNPNNFSASSTRNPNLSPTNQGKNTMASQNVNSGNQVKSVPPSNFQKTNTNSDNTKQSGVGNLESDKVDSASKEKPLTENELIDQQVAKYDSNAPVDPEWYSHRVISSLLPLRLVMLTFFRLPIKLTVNIIDKYEFNFVPCHLNTILFLLFSLFNILLTILFGVNLLGIVTNYPGQAKYEKNRVVDHSKNGSNVSYLSPSILRAEELYIYKRNFVPVVMIFTCLIQGSVASFLFFYRRKFMAYFLSFFTEAAEITRINFAHDQISFMWIFMSGWVLFLICLLILTAINFSPVTGGYRAILVHMAYRCFEPAIFADPWLPGAFRGLKIFHGLFFLFTFVNSKIYILLFMWFCRLIRNGFVVWNHRIDSVLLKDEKKRLEAERQINRTGFRHMFTDHVILIDLIQGIDRLFAGTCEIYYLSQAFSICFEFYYLIRSQANAPEFDSTRRRDGLIILIWAMQSIIVLFYVTMAASDINDEALEGLEVIRKKGMIGQMKDAELYFILSMYVSYTGHFDISIACANYAVMNKSFVTLVLNTIWLFLVIIAQISPPLTLTDIKQLNILMEGKRELDY